MISEQIVTIFSYSETFYSRVKKTQPFKIIKMAKIQAINSGLWLKGPSTILEVCLPENHLK